MKKITFLSTLLVAGAFAFSANAADDFSKGTDYHLIFLDEETATQISPENIAKDFRPDDTNNFLYVWENTYIGNTATGPNWNGVVGEYLTFSVASVGWSGLGFASVAGSPKDMSGITSDFTFHIAMKSTDNASHLLIIGGDTEAKVCIGSTPFVDGAVTYQPVADFARDGQWHLIEIPMSTFFTLGLTYTEPTSGNVVAFLSGATTGTKLEMDAIFFYKKFGVGVNSVDADKLNVFVSDKTLTVAGATAPVELYNIAGAKVKVSNEAIMDIEDLQSGIYIVRCGGLTEKVQIK